MMQLLIRHITGRFAKHFPVAWLSNDLTRNGVELHNLSCGALCGPMPSCKHSAGGKMSKAGCRHARRPRPTNLSVTRLLIVRDPYARLLSGFLFALASHDPRAHPRSRKLIHPVLGNLSQFNATPASFAEFLRLFRQAQPPRYLHSDFLEHHLLPLTKFRLSSIGNKFGQSHVSGGRPCWQLPAGVAYGPPYFDRVLKLEQMEEWYPGFVEELGLREAALDPKWG
jgi:hypothetical protein